jgi:hypothetical protein
MFTTLFTALAVAAILFIGYLLLKPYLPFTKRSCKAASAVPPPVQETFQAPQPPKPTKVNTPAPPTPAPAPLISQDAPLQEREVSPGGPSAPNAAPPAGTRPTLSPEVKPTDPYEDGNMEAPIHDSMRYPELSFGPGVDNTGMNQLALSGVGNAKASASESPFSPEFAQNGANFMGDVGANDLTHDSTYAFA